MGEYMSEPDRRIRPDRRPLYLLVVDALRDLIEERGLTVGSALPSEPELARIFDVGRSTVREAMMQLENEGIVERRRGVGTALTALARQPHLGLDILEPLEELAIRQGWSCGTRDLTISPGRADADHAARLGVPEGSPVTLVRRTKTRDSRPMAVMDSVVPVRVLSHEEIAQGFTDSIITLIGDSSSLRYARAEVTAVGARTEHASRLDIRRGQALVVLHELFFGDEDDRPLVWNTNFFVPEMIQLEMLRRRPRR
ncbi:GntR family transcriptional regulator [Streptosporangium violaceochromogenes]|nr:GntR family transcriptional regulator [Streptosporangium violaceochromogenes]